MIMKKILFLILILFVVVLAWAPWMGKNKFNEEAVKNCANNEWQNSVDGGYIGEYWVPFGRWVVHCEGSWYSFFTGRALWYVMEK